jgi:hypothetical protein
VHLAEIAANYVFLRFCGFQCLELGGVVYWYRKQTAEYGHEYVNTGEYGHTEYGHTGTDTGTDTSTDTYIDTDTDTDTDTAAASARASEHTHTHTHEHTHKHTRKHTHEHTHKKYTHTQHTHKHAHKQHTHGQHTNNQHTNKHTNKHTHKHTHDRDPVLFFGGISTGWGLYLQFVKNIAAGAPNTHILSFNAFLIP